MNKKGIFIGFSIIILFIVGIFLAQHFYPKTNENDRENARLLSVITTTYPAYTKEDKPVIEISSVVTIDTKWHIVTIKSLRAGENFVPVKVIIFDANTVSRVVAGPDTSFDETVLLKQNVPDSVILELRKL